MAVHDPGDNVSEIAERLDAVEFAGFDQRSDDGPVFGVAVGAGEERILSVESNHPSIQPISVRMLKFLIAGMHFMDAVFG